MNKKKRGIWLNLTMFLLFVIFIALSFILDFDKGKDCAASFGEVMLEMMKILPAAFLVIALIEVWVSQDTIIKHLGDNSGFMAYIWVLILASISIGGIFTGLPLAESLHRKGASLKVVFAYLGFVGVVRIPMTVFEITFLGVSFTAVRLMVTIPLFLVVGIIWGNYLKKKGFQFKT